MNQHDPLSVSYAVMPGKIETKYNVLYTDAYKIIACEPLVC